MGAIRDHRRDLFPLPEVHSKSWVRRRQGPRQARALVQSPAPLEELEARAVSALNDMAGCSDSGTHLGGGRSRAASVAFVHDACAALGPCPEEETNARAAFEALRGSGLHSVEDSHVAPYDASKVSLPDSASHAVPLAQLWGAGGSKLVEDFCAENVLLPEAASERLEQAPHSPYVDSQLRHNRKSYSAFVRRLAAAGMIEFRRSCVETVGLFFVRKKSGKLRLVFDARRSNCWFTDAKSVNLATGSCLGEIQIGEGETLFYWPC